MENNAEYEGRKIGSLRRITTDWAHDPESATDDEARELAEQTAPAIYDPGVRFISLSNSLNVRVLGGLGFR